MKKDGIIICDSCGARLLGYSELVDVHYCYKCAPNIIRGIEHIPFEVPKPVFMSIKPPINIQQPGLKKRLRKWDIGNEAKLLDEKSIKERMKIEGRSVKKMFVVLLIYIAVMIIFLMCV